MNYKVHIEFTSPRKWFQPFAWMVRQFERTPYSHVRLRWFSTSGEELIYEASGSSVKLIGAYAKHNFPVRVLHRYTFELSAEQYRTMIALFRFAGVSYGVTQIIGIGLARVLGLKDNPLASGETTQVCSELVGFFIQDVLGYPVGNLDLIGPKGIKDILDERIV